MRLIASIILFFVTFHVWALNDVNNILRLRVIESPQELLHKVDSLESIWGEVDYKLDYLRSYAYYSMFRYSKAYEYALSAFKSEDIKSDTAVFDRTLILLAENAVLSYRVEEACEILNKGLIYAKNKSDNSLIANMIFIEGIMFRKVGNLKDSYSNFEKAMEMLNQNHDVGSLLRVSQIMDCLCSSYISDNMPEEAWRIAKDREALIEKLKDSGLGLGIIDRQEANLYSKEAYLAQKQGRVLLAEDYYDKYLSTNYSKTNIGLIEINDYLLEVGRYKEVIQNNRTFFIGVDIDDVVSVIYQRALRQSSIAYREEGNYIKAYQALSKLMEIKDRHRLSIDRQLVLFKDQTSDLLQYKLELEKAESDLQKNYQLMIFFAVISLLLLIMFVLVLYDRKRLNAKNKKISSLLLELRDTKEQSEQNLMKNLDEMPHDYKLFVQFDDKVRNERLYLNYQMQRDDFAQLMGVDRNRFAAIIKEYTGGGNLNSYLNDMRLEYSIFLLKNHPEMSIQEVGEASALPSSTTFYRLFKEKYDISPKVFKEQMG